MNYVGIDYHKKYSVVTAVDKEGHVLRTCRLDNRPEQFHDFLASLGGPCKAVLETSRTWGLLYDLLEEIDDLLADVVDQSAEGLVLVTDEVRVGFELALGIEQSRQFGGGLGVAAFDEPAAEKPPGGRIEYSEHTLINRLPGGFPCPTNARVLETKISISSPRHFLELRTWTISASGVTFPLDQSRS